MNVCSIIGFTAVGLIWILATFLLVCICHKRIMTSATPSSVLLLAISALIFYGIQQAICYYVPDMWWISIFFLLFIVFILLALWFMLTGTLIVKDDCIYRLSWYMVFRKYTYAEIDNYWAGQDTSTVNTRFGSRRVTTYEIDVHFCDQTASSISFRNENVPKAILLRDNLRSHRCRRKK